MTQVTPPSIAYIATQVSVAVPTSTRYTMPMVVFHTGPIFPVFIACIF
jgi:hypothetical protein